VNLAGNTIAKNIGIEIPSSNYRLIPANVFVNTLMNKLSNSANFSSGSLIDILPSSSYTLVINQDRFLVMGSYLIRGPAADAESSDSDYIITNLKGNTVTTDGLEELDSENIIYIVPNPRPVLLWLIEKNQDLLQPAFSDIRAKLQRDFSDYHIEEGGNGVNSLRLTIRIGSSSTDTDSVYTNQIQHDSLLFEKNRKVRAVFKIIRDIVKKLPLFSKDHTGATVLKECESDFEFTDFDNDSSDLRQIKEIALTSEKLEYDEARLRERRLDHLADMERKLVSLTYYNDGPWKQKAEPLNDFYFDPASKWSGKLVIEVSLDSSTSEASNHEIYSPRGRSGYPWDFLHDYFEILAPEPSENFVSKKRKAKLSFEFHSWSGSSDSLTRALGTTGICLECF